MSEKQTDTAVQVTVQVSPVAQRNFQRLVDAAGAGSLQEYLQTIVNSFEHEETVRVALFTMKMARMSGGGKR